MLEIDKISLGNKLTSEDLNVRYENLKQSNSSVKKPKTYALHIFLRFKALIIRH